MTVALSITYDTTINSRNVDAYKLQMTETGADLSAFAQVGPCSGNVVSYSGVFATQVEAVSAALDYIGPDTACKLVEVTGPFQPTVSLMRVDQRIKTNEWDSARVIGSQNHRGRFLAA